MARATTASSPPPVSRRHRYWAFISYSWDDGHHARSLHRRLETYSIPRSIRQKLSAEVSSARRLRPVFRDDDEMPASGVLSDRLRTALDESRTLIVIASPAAAASTYVNYEVDYFVGTRGTDHVVTIVVDGKPGGLPGREPMPAALRGSELLWVPCRHGVASTGAAFCGSSHMCWALTPIHFGVGTLGVAAAKVPAGLPLW